MRLDDLPITAFTCGVDGALSFSSRALAELTGFDAHELLRKTFPELADEADRQRVCEAWNVARARAAAYRDEFRLACSDGTSRWVLAVAEPLRDGANDATATWFGTLVDVHASHLAADALRESESLHRSLSEALPGVTWAASPTGELTYVGERWLELHDEQRAHALGDRWLAALHPDDRRRVANAWRRSLETLEPYTIEFRVKLITGNYKWFLVQALPVLAPDGSVIRWVGVNIDIDDRHTAEEARKRLEQGLRLLSRTGAAVVDSLDYQRTLQNIARAFVDGYAAYCLIDVIPPVGPWERTAEHRDRAYIPLLLDLARPAGNHPVARAIHAGESSVTHVDDAWAANLDSLDDRLDAIRRLRVRSIISVPVVTPSGDIVGALTCALDDASSREDFTADDLAFVAEVGRRAGAAIANVQLYQRDRRIALELQAASLPANLPDFPGVVLDAAYRPGSNEAKIGGDWYDAFALADGCLAITVGDVLGHGLQAAVSMTKLRLAMQSAAFVQPDPNVMLRVADATLRVSDPDAYATAIAAIYDPRKRSVTFASAGHPGPILRTAGGGTEDLTRSGPMLGLRTGEELETHTVGVPSGSALVFYTDGLIEVRRDGDEGLRRLSAALRCDRVIEAEHPGEALVDAVLDGRRASDDVAVLVATFGAQVPAAPR